MKGYRRRNKDHQKSIGYQKALDHIHDAHALTRELGGTDKDVKEYFFNLPTDQLEKVFDRYEFENGPSAREYAEITYKKWASGKVHMSGLVAERLFRILPPTMPLEVKYQLTKSLWYHVGPSSTKTFYVGVVQILMI